MSDTLTQLIAKLQALLLGDATTFSTETCTAAIRQALNHLNLNIPQHAAETQAAVSQQYEYQLTDLSALLVVDVLREGSDTYNEYNISIPFDAYFEDDRPCFRLRFPEATGTTLIVRYAKPYTINGLDSATDSTIPDQYIPTLLDGSAWQACVVRAAGRVETINMNADVTVNWSKMAETFRLAFDLGLINLARRRFPVSEPRTQGWGDKWEGQW
jgi:hypothetical protein